MSKIIELDIFRFLLIYLLLILILFIMKKSGASQTKILLTTSLRMTVQLVIAGFILTYIFKNTSLFFTSIYLAAMVVFAYFRIVSKNKWLNPKFRITVFIALAISSIAVLAYFTIAVINVNFFNPQYAIPLGGMVIGNSMTGISLALNSFSEKLSSETLRTETLINFGVSPDEILSPYVNSSLETALIPTLNSMAGMGIVSLPGLMTGQILSGTLPTTAILYQISIMICVCASVSLSVFISLKFGFKTIIDKDAKINLF